MTTKPDDRRVLRTRRALHDAFYALFVEKGYEAITIQDILDRADVGRSTFYQHFAGKQDLMLKGMENLRGWLVARQRESPEASSVPGVGFSRAMFGHVEHLRPYYRALARDAFVQREVQRLIADLVRTDIAARLSDGSAATVPVDLLAEFAASGFMATLGWWMEQRAPMTVAEIDAVYRALVVPGIERALAGSHGTGSAATG